MATVSVFYAKGNKRSEVITEAAYQGLLKIGDKPVLLDSKSYTGVNSDYAVFYGLASGLSKIFEDYKREATAVYIDLGYWQRSIKTRYDGYHKLVVNSRHPTTYFQRQAHCLQRFRDLNLKIKPWQKAEGGGILLASMSQKAAIAEGLLPFAWEQQALRSLLKHTDRVVTYRPKPNCPRARPIKGALFDKRMALPLALQHCHAVVTRQSNTAVDALLSGVPVFCELGVASVMGHSDLTQIESPRYPDNREQWAADIAWCQFTTAEIKAGLPFKHLKNEWLIP